MKYVVNSCIKKDKTCTIDELFKSDFLKTEKELISKKDEKELISKKEKEKK